jgi:hypothetical protein
MSLIPFPNVPQLPGVPQVARAANSALTAALPVLGAAAAVGALWRSLFVETKWGVYKQTPPPAPDTSGVATVTVTAKLVPVITPDSILDFGYHNEYDISDYPLEEGSFTNYNKVANPFETSVRMAKGGSESDRRTFLDQIETITASLDFFYILTPERTYVNVNPYRIEMTRRGAGGAFYLSEVDLYFKEVRTSVQTYTNTSTATQNAQDPSATPVDNVGAVSGDTPAVPPDLSGVINQ